MNSSEYQSLQVKKWRSITYNWDILSTYSNESRLYCLTEFQAAWLLSNTEYLRWQTRWQNCPCTQSDLDAIKAEMDLNLMSCIDFQPYQLQTLYQNAQNALIAEYESNWDGMNPSSVNPSAPDTDFDGDGSQDRVDALCTALTIWTYSYAVDWSTKASLILGIAYSAASIVDGLLPVGGNIAVQAVHDLLEPIQDQVDALSNVSALDVVICDWKNQLLSLSITASNWTDEIQGLSYTSETDEWYIQQLLASDTQLLSNFLSFVNSLGDAYELAQIGVFICPCEVWVWETTFAEDENIWSPFNNVGEDEAIWTDGVGYESADAKNATNTWSRLIFIETSTFTELTKITQVRFEYSLTKGSYDSDAPALHISLARDSGGRETQQNSASTSPAGNNLLYTFNLSNDDYEDIWLYVRSSASNGSEVYSGSCQLHSVRISGVGFNPFE